jgi:hypothetical protein
MDALQGDAIGYVGYDIIVFLALLAINWVRDNNILGCTLSTR